MRSGRGVGESGIFRATVVAFMRAHTAEIAADDLVLLGIRHAVELNGVLLLLSPQLREINTRLEEEQNDVQIPW